MPDQIERNPLLVANAEIERLKLALLDTTTALHGAQDEAVTERTRARAAERTANDLLMERDIALGKIDNMRQIATSNAEERDSWKARFEGLQMDLEGTMARLEHESERRFEAEVALTRQQTASQWVRNACAQAIRDPQAHIAVQVLARAVTHWLEEV